MCFLLCSIVCLRPPLQALATTRVNIRPAGAMRDQGYVVQAGGMGGMVQRTFSGGSDETRREGYDCGVCAGSECYQVCSV